MANICVAPLSRLAAVARETGARRVVSLVTAGTPVARPKGVAAGAHLRLELSDIAAPLAGHVLAAEGQVAALLRFAEGWDRAEGPLLLHCFAGVSRSPAAAFALACHLRPEIAEAEHARALRRLSPSATPNARIVALADGLLGRGGRMVEAIRAIGRGAECFEGEVFTWRLAGG